jgi:hypothetical protein
MGAKLSLQTSGAICRSAVPTPATRGTGCRQSLIELALPHLAVFVSLHGTGRALIVWADAHSGPPYLDVFDKAGRWLT